MTPLTVAACRFAAHPPIPGWLLGGQAVVSGAGDDDRRAA
jgi:hypothetical protein